MNFVYETLPTRVVFGAGYLTKAGDELDRLNITRALLLSTPQQEEQVRRFALTLGERCVAIYASAAMHTPVTVTLDAMRVLESCGADGLVALGGGSTIGLSKALALRTDLPQLVIPTTYAGSEMTPIIGQTENDLKTTQRTLKVLPEAVIYDPELTMTLPPHVSGSSGMNAIAHAVEALYAENANPVISMMAEESIRVLGYALPNLTADNTIKLRSEALYGAWLAGICLGSVGMAIHHKICHTLGGTFDLSHADIHCLMIPYSAAYNRAAAPEAMGRIGRALGTDDGPGGLYELMLKLATKKSLRDFGLNEADLDHAAGLAVKNPYYNPQPISLVGIRQMLDQAYWGRRP